MRGQKTRALLGLLLLRLPAFAVRVLGVFYTALSILQNDIFVSLRIVLKKNLCEAGDHG